MKRILGLFAASMVLAAGVPTMSAAQDEGLAAGAEGEVNASTEVICKRQPAPTGSRIGARNICKTEIEWARLEQEARNSLEEVGNRNRMLNEHGNANCGAFNRGC